MSVLVTGGAGFIGSHLVDRLIDDGHDEVLVLDALTYAGRRENLEHHDERVTLLHGDICDADIVKSAMEGRELVYHLAAESHVDRSIVAADAFVQTNVVGTYTLLEAARQEEVDRFVHISTDEVYGSIDDGAFRETDPLDPSSPYSASKASSDLMALAYHRTYGMDVVVTRSSNNYGPRQFPEKLIPLMTLRAMSNEKLPIYGDGLNVRDWLHVTDNCRGLTTVAKNGVAGEAYNIGAEMERTNIDVVQAILARLGKGSDLIEYVTDRLGHDRRYAVDATKAQALGWSPTVSFEEGIAQTVDWYRANEAWWSPLLG